MRIVIAGGHGKIALILERLLSQRGDSVAGFIRNPEHAADLEAAGAEPVVADLENASVDEVAPHLQGADAVVFAAGAGPGSGAARCISLEDPSSLGRVNDFKWSRFIRRDSVGSCWRGKNTT